MVDISSISGIRANSNYPYSRKLIELYSWISGLFFKFTFFGSPKMLSYWQVTYRKAPAKTIIYFIILHFFPYFFFIPAMLLIFSILNKLTIEGIHMVFDIVDANIAQVAYLSSLRKSSTNSADEGDNNVPSAKDIIGISELKEIANQFKQQTEVLNKSIEELSEKAEKTNTYLYHIYKK